MGLKKCQLGGNAELQQDETTLALLVQEESAAAIKTAVEAVAAATADTAAIKTAVEKATATGASVLYTLRAAANWAAYAALGTKPVAIAAGANNWIEFYLANAAASQTGSIVLLQSSASPLAVADYRRPLVTSVGSDVFTGNLLSFGGADAAAYHKNPIRLTIQPGRYVYAFMLAGSWVGYYELGGGV